MKKETKLKDFLTKKQFKIFTNERLLNSKIKRISTYQKSYIIFEIIPTKKNWCISIPNGYNVQSINFRDSSAVITVSNREYKHIMNEVNYFRRFPKAADKLKFTII